MTLYHDSAINKRKTWFLMSGFFVLVMLVGYAISWYFNNSTFLIIAFIFSAVSSLTSYWWSDKIVLTMANAAPLDRTTAEGRVIYRLVENLCITAGLPVPKIYLIEDSSPNAFATGRKPETASIALSRGAIEKLTNEELEGVIAHELSHIKNYDIRFMTLVAVMVGVIALLSDMMWRFRVFGGRRSNKNEGEGQLGIILLIAGIVFAILSPIIAELIKLAISRRREYLADASGALLTRYPEGLANALEKIAQENLPMQHAATATAHLYLASPFKEKSVKSLFSTHPPIADRIAKLRTMGR